MALSKEELRSKIIKSLKSQGFSINPHLRPKRNAKDTFRKIHSERKLEKMRLHRRRLLENLKLVKEFSIDGKDVRPEDIELELKEVKPDSQEAELFFWWNLVWWSLPFEHPYGRQMRFLLWDKTRDAPFGLVGLQSPPLKMGIRDQYLGIGGKKLDYWINQSMYAQRVGALPPYNELLGAKMAALTLACSRLRKLYESKYDNMKTIISKRKIPAQLLFVSTTSAYGKSSVYERLKYYEEKICAFLGFTAGAGTFHLSEDMYEEILLFLKQKGIGTKRGYGHGPSRKLKLIDMAFNRLGLPNFTYHGIKRGFYLFPHVRNLSDVIHKNAKPKWYSRNFGDLTEYWKMRWCLPRAERINSWRNFTAKQYLNSVERTLAKFN